MTREDRRALLWVAGSAAVMVGVDLGRRILTTNDEARFPLYPGQRTTIEYAYTVGTDKWGHWFQRAVRLPTAKLS